MPCWPTWHPTYLAIAASPGGKKTISSGCATADGNVQCDPESMRARAEQVVGRPISLATYTLARYMQSEVGDISVEERVAVGEAAVNQARRRKTDVNGLLLTNPGTRAANRGYYGPIHGPEGISTAPYGRWAATSADPTVATLLIADLVMTGGSGNFAQGADDQDGMEYFNDPEGKVVAQAKAGNYWVGPLVGVNPWRTTLWRHYGITSADLLARGLAFARAREKSSGKWRASPPVIWDADMPVCSPTNWKLIGAAVGALLLGGAIWLGRHHAEPT